MPISRYIVVAVEGRNGDPIVSLGSRMIKDTAGSCHAARNLLSRLGHGCLDPYFHWTRWRMGRAREKSLWMNGIGSGEPGRPRSDALVGQAVRPLRGGQYKRFVGPRGFAT